MFCCMFFFFFKQKTAYEMRISDWSSDVCSSDLILLAIGRGDRNVDGHQRIGADDLVIGRRIGVEVDDVNLALRRGVEIAASRIDRDRSKRSVDIFDVCATTPAQHDRKSASEGKRVSVIVDLGGGSHIKKKKTIKKKK